MIQPRLLITGFMITMKINQRAVQIPAMVKIAILHHRLQVRRVQAIRGNSTGKKINNIPRGCCFFTLK